MAVTIVDSAYDFQGTKSPIGLKVSTDSLNLIDGVKSVNKLLITGTPYPTVGQYFSLTWDNYVEGVIFTIGNTLNPEGTVVRPNSTSLSLSAYTAQVMADIMRNTKMIDNYDFSTTTAGEITITAKNIGTKYDLRPYITDVAYPSIYLDAIVTGGVDEVIKENFTINTEVNFESVKDSGNFPVIATLDAYPFNLNAKFDLSDILNSNLRYLKPNLSVSGIITFTDTLKRYKISIFEKYGNPVVSMVKTKPTGYGYALKGGVRYGDWTGSAKNIIQYLCDNLLFNTTYTSDKPVLKNQPEFLYAIAPGPFSKLLTVTLYYTDGTNSTHTIASAALGYKFDMVYFRCGYNDLNIDTIKTAGKTVNKYIVYLKFIDVDTSTIMAVYPKTFIVNNTEYLENKFFLFTNQYGGFETLLCTGSQIESPNIERDVAETFKDYEHKSEDFSLISFNSKSQTIKKQYSGYMTRFEMDWVNQFFLSDERYEVVNGKLIPIILSSKSYEKYKTGKNLNSFEFEYAYAYRDIV